MIGAYVNLRRWMRYYPKTASSVPEQMIDPPPAREAAMVALRCSKLQFSEVVRSEHIWLVVSTHLKNISQSGNLPQVGVKITNIETTT